MIIIYPTAMNVKDQNIYFIDLSGCLTKKQMQNPTKNNISSISIPVKSLRLAQFHGGVFYLRDTTLHILHDDRINSHTHVSNHL